MEIYILDPLTLDRIGMVDVYQSFIWETKYNDVGSFELACSMDYFDLLQPERIVQNSCDSKHCCLIEFVSKKTNDDGSESLIVKGRGLEVLLDRRICQGEYSYDSWQPTAIIADIIRKNAITPANRKIGKLEIGTLVNADLGTVSWAGSNASLLNEIKELCQESLIGFNLLVDDVGKRLVFNTYKGTNRTESDNTETDIQTQSTLNLIPNGEFTSQLSSWLTVDDGINWMNDRVLSVVGGILEKKKIVSRKPKYTPAGAFEDWEYIWAPSGYVHQNISLQSDHIYYISTVVDNQTSSVIGCGIMDAENKCTFQCSKGYHQYDAFFVPDKNGQYKFALGYGELPEGKIWKDDGNILYDKVPPIFIYYGLIIDLTATFGIGKEPNLEFCSKNIYKSGNGWQYKTETIHFVPNYNDPLILSRDRDNLLEVEYTKAIINEGNYLHIKGDGLVTNISLPGFSDVGLKERFLDLSSEVPREIEGVTIPIASYVAMLQTRGRANLKKLVINEVIDGTLYQLNSIKLNQDFFVGDIVDCMDKSIGFVTSLRITGSTEVWDINGYSVSVTLGDELPDITETIKLVGKGAK